MDIEERIQLCERSPLSHGSSRQAKPMNSRRQGSASAASTIPPTAPVTRRRQISLATHSQVSKKPRSSPCGECVLEPAALLAVVALEAYNVFK